MATDVEPERTAPRPRPSWRHLLLLAGVAVIAYGLDLLTKTIVVETLPLHERNEILGEFLIFQHVENPGAAFSLAEGMTWVFTIIATAVVVLIVVFSRRIRHIGWAVLFGMLLGGVLGNLTDRLFRDPGFGVGHVVDFIYTPWMLPAIYNVADIFVVSSLGLFILLTVLSVNLDGTRPPKRVKGERADAATADEDEAPSADGGAR